MPLPTTKIAIWIWPNRIQAWKLCKILILNINYINSVDVNDCLNIGMREPCAHACSHPQNQQTGLNVGIFIHGMIDDPCPSCSTHYPISSIILWSLDCWVPTTEPRRQLGSQHGHGHQSTAELVCTGKGVTNRAPAWALGATAVGAGSTPRQVGRLPGRPGRRTIVGNGGWWRS